MRVRLTLGLLLVAVFGVLPARPQVPRGSQLLVLTNANVIDGVSEKPIRRATVIVRDGNIVSVAAASPVTVKKFVQGVITHPTPVPRRAST